MFSKVLKLELSIFYVEIIYPYVMRNLVKPKEFYFSDTAKLRQERNANWLGERTQSYPYSGHDQMWKALTNMVIITKYDSVPVIHV
jgi:hypothetical protein